MRIFFDRGDAENAEKGFFDGAGSRRFALARSIFYHGLHGMHGRRVRGFFRAGSRRFALAHSIFYHGLHGLHGRRLGGIFRVGVAALCAGSRVFGTTEYTDYTEEELEGFLSAEKGIYEA